MNSFVLVNVNTPWDYLEEGNIIAFRSGSTEVMHRITSVTDKGLILEADNINVICHDYCRLFEELRHVTKFPSKLGIDVEMTTKSVFSMVCEVLRMEINLKSFMRNLEIREK